MSSTLQYVVLVLCLLLTGCGQSAIPAPASRPISTTDLLGRWAYSGNSNTTSIIIEFRKGGSFEQTLSGPAIGMVQRGTWRLSGANVELQNVLMNQDGKSWSRDDFTFWFSDESGELQLFGGEFADEKLCAPLEYLGPSLGR